LRGATGHAGVYRAARQQARVVVQYFAARVLVVCQGGRHRAVDDVKLFGMAVGGNGHFAARAPFNAFNQLFFAVADGDEFFAFAADQPWVCHFNFLIVVTAVQVNLGAQVFQRVFLVVLRNQRRIEVAISRRLAVAAFGAVHACNQGACHQAVVFQLVGAVSVHRQRVAVAIRIVFAARGQNRGVAA